ncbi:MAG: hypothetical protein A2534_00175 [Candidatus Magasanikbacteria bacterium RIFOXYD2_FULL_39_9]|uniref:Vitamin K epoxide reductase domain-containing protein n=1 Tax=Candidatus Magasanikbacteria bacterium RIFOXYD1_FULL_40_23 TaxID=1798705 RepID=A0A1F6P8W4_9BACT|nr:MAG: hypothetical protein A2563_02930 [Candidatus Magasanikbacteria bacterium RIFOXYD1_FULL_40_23]OGH93561.1 MAG: hypothetical protein A2534_00175 [Candidatus Magasanikbacteria bacterium RIFOXYD2_FULL_39_9]
MKNLEAFSKQLVAPSNLFLFAFLGLAAIGFADATYLTVKYFIGAPVTCAILKGCEQVTTSHYSLFFGQPVALAGSLYYLSVLLLTAIYLESKNRTFFLLANILTFFGFLVSARFVYLQIFVIKALCIYCMVSATTSTLLFSMSLFSLRKNKNTSLQEQEIESPKSEV